MNLAREHSVFFRRARMRGCILIILAALVGCSLSYFVRNTLAEKIASTRVQNTKLMFKQEVLEQFYRVQKNRKHQQTLLDALQGLDEFKKTNISFQKIEFNAGSFFAYSRERNRQSRELVCWEQQKDPMVYAYQC